ncbi:uncharacterized protein LOC134012689 [Osmerus eperlanus]|uniref:uncharacterized protein LOC134012689 n=1 Tax=Osmerus eperlanus TaxID=29151 RepID=UPI002E0D8517
MAYQYQYQLPLADDYSSELEEFCGKIKAPIIVEEVSTELLEMVVDSEQKRFLADLSHSHRPILAQQLYEELAAAGYIISHVPDELLEMTEKKSAEKAFLAAVSESLFLALLPPEAIQLVATGHITDVRAEKALVKAEAKELVMPGLKTAASKVVEDLIAAAVEMVHTTTPLDTQISQTRKVALINGKSEIAAEDVLNELLDKVVKESEKRRSLALISVSDCPLLATQLPQLTDLVPEKCSGFSAPCSSPLDIFRHMERLPTDKDRQVKKKKKKKGIRAFFRGLWKRMICSSGIPKED